MRSLRLTKYLSEDLQFKFILHEKLSLESKVWRWEKQQECKFEYTIKIGISTMYSSQMNL